MLKYSLSVCYGSSVLLRTSWMSLFVYHYCVIAINVCYALLLYSWGYRYQECLQIYISTVIPQHAMPKFLHPRRYFTSIKGMLNSKTVKHEIFLPVKELVLIDTKHQILVIITILLMFIEIALHNFLLVLQWASH